MSQPKFAFFEQAIKAGKSYIQTSVRARDSQYLFLALAYLAHRNERSYPNFFPRLIELEMTGYIMSDR